MPISKYRLYEETVQSPDWQVDYLPQFHQWLTKKKPLRFREDFCGTARIACEWVKRNPLHRAGGLDLDSKVLSYAEKVNRAALDAGAQKRLLLRKQNVQKPTREKYDWIGAFNYSIFTFHERADLLSYFNAARASLDAKGTLFLEIAGGPGFLRAKVEKASLVIPGIGKITQAWEQQDFDPIQQLNDYAIHFQLPNGDWLQNAFTYHWRIWSIRELRELLEEAGFKKSVVLWEQSDAEGEPSNEFFPSEEAPNTDFYLAYVVGVK
jgi:hypothetical protein